MHTAESLLRQIRALPPERIAEVADFVAFIAAREQGRFLTPAPAGLVTPAFVVAGDGADDDCLDEL
jgi:hypothetical protein